MVYYRNVLLVVFLCVAQICTGRAPDRFWNMGTAAIGVIIKFNCMEVLF